MVRVDWRYCRKYQWTMWVRDLWVFLVLQDEWSKIRHASQQEPI